MLATGLMCSIDHQNFTLKISVTVDYNFVQHKNLLIGKLRPVLFPWQQGWFTMTTKNLLQFNCGNFANPFSGVALFFIKMFAQLICKHVVILGSTSKF